MFKYREFSFQKQPHQKVYIQSFFQSAMCFKILFAILYSGNKKFETLAHFHFNENIISSQGGISKVYIRHFAWANGRVEQGTGYGWLQGGARRVERRHPVSRTPVPSPGPDPSAGSIRHLSWSPWRPRTERGGAAASGWWVHATPRTPRARTK